MTPLWRLLFLLFAASAYAAPPVCPDGSAPPRQPLSEEARWLERHTQQCADDPAFLAWYGAVLLALGQPAAAAEQLERALLLDPGHLGARLDYARALIMLGDAAGTQLHEELAAEANLPPAARDYLDRWQSSRRQTWAELGLDAGWDSNLNRATRLTQLGLSLPDGDLSLPLAADARARAGSFLAARAALGSRRSLASGGELELMGELSMRATPGNAKLSQQQADLIALWHRPQDGGETIWLLGAGQMDFGGDTLQRSLRGGLRRVWAQPQSLDCKPMLGLDVENRLHPATATLDHRHLQAQAAWLCNGARPLYLQLAAGREFAPHRPGGDAWRISARGLVWIPLLDASWLQAEVRIAWRQDDEGYSPLLQHGARLTTHTAAVRLDWRHPLSAGLEASIALELERQQANLPLFQVDRQVLSIGLVQRW